MKLGIYSDLHLEFDKAHHPDKKMRNGTYLSDLVIEDEADVRIYAGDIGVKMQPVKWLKDTPVPSIFVPGNHEAYGKAIPHHFESLRRGFAGSNVHFLEKNETIIDGVRFLGTTLWTDFMLFGPAQAFQAELKAAQIMNDYHSIRVSPAFKPLTVFETKRQFTIAIKWLEEKLFEPFDGPTVVVTHHAPSMRSIAPRYEKDLLSAAFASDLDAFI